MKLVMNDLRKGIVATLKNANEPMTLNEIGAVLGKEIKTGTTNAMVANGVIRKVGTKRVPRTTFVEVATYEFGVEPTEDQKA